MAGDLAGDGGDVTGGHHGLDAEAMQQCDCLARAGTRLVGDCQQCDETAVEGDEDRRPALVSERRRLRQAGGTVDAGLREQRRVADQHRMVLADGTHTAPGYRLELAAFCRRDHLCRAPGSDRPAQEVLGASLRSRNDCQQPAPVDGGGREEIGEHRSAFGDRAGLVEDDRVQPGSAFQCLAVSDVDAAPRCLAGTDHDCRRRRQPECTWTGDEQDRDGVCQSRRRRTAGEQPAAEGQPGDAADGRNEAFRDAVGEPLHRQLAALCMVDQADDSRQHGVGTDRSGAQREAAVAVDAAGVHTIAAALADRQRLAAEQRFVHLRTAGLDDAVGRNALAGTHAQQVADDDLVDRHLLLAAVAQEHRSRHLQLAQLADRLARLPLGALLEEAAEEDEADDAGGGLEIDVVRRLQQARQAVQVSRAGADRDQRVHVGALLLRHLPGLGEDVAAGAEKHRRCQCDLEQAQCRRAMHRHAEQHHRCAQGSGDDDALSRQRESLLCARDEQAPLRQRVHRLRPVAEPGDHCEHLVTADRAADDRRLRGEIDVRQVDARITAQRQLDQQGA
ncbi:MAG: hypothetical protein AW07_02035 [Candidatus Accumulibacter sp. SK-11]|nr:MAG: hypothetical protein AW07_02035 [Candidatus Accumulibacter sp. SK-11]